MDPQAAPKLIPNGSRAVVDITKLRDYCLNPLHPRGRHKARVFTSALGLVADDADWLRIQLQAAAEGHDAIPTGQDSFGDRYVIDFSVRFRSRAATIRSCWIIRRGEDIPRLTSCFVK